MAGVRFYTIREPGEPLIPGIRFLCKRIGAKEPVSANHSELRWVTEEDFMDLPDDDFVGDLKHEVIDLLTRYGPPRR